MIINRLFNEYFIYILILNLNKFNNNIQYKTFYYVE